MAYCHADSVDGASRQLHLSSATPILSMSGTVPAVVFGSDLLRVMDFHKKLIEHALKVCLRAPTMQRWHVFDRPPTQTLVICKIADETLLEAVTPMSSCFIDWIRITEDQ